MSARKGVTARRVAAVVAIAAGVTLGLTGCGAGQISQTATQVSAVNGNRADVGPIALRNVHVAYPTSQEYTNSKGGKSALAFTVVNQSADKADRLVKIGTDVGTVVLPSDEKASLPPLRTVVAAAPGKPDEPQADVNGSDPEAAPVTVEIRDLKSDLTPGLTIPMTFSFQQAGDVTVNVPIDAGSSTPRQPTGQSDLSEGPGTKHEGSTRSGQEPGGQEENGGH